MIESIKVDGILQPILVRPIMDSYMFEVVEGEHRREAAIVASLETMPCLVRAMTDDEAALIQLKANAVRPEDTRKYEYARRLKKFIDDGMTLYDLSAKVDKSPTWIKTILKLNNLCDRAIKPVNYGEIPLTSAIALGSLPMDMQEKFIDDASSMVPIAFITRVREARVDYDAFLLKRKQEERLCGITPKMRTLNALITELDGFEQAKAVMDATGALTPLDGWKACLAWMLKIDPLTIEKRLNKIAEAPCAYLTEMEKSEFRTRLVTTLVSDKLKPDYSVLGEHHVK
jgi:ParB/RepB/Spo0J family partition protein